MDSENSKKTNTKKIQLIIATKNIHKIREYKSILNELIPNIDLLSLFDFPNYTPPLETGSTFEENAKLKALDASIALNAWVIADDSGLIIPALNNEPGIYSARYAGNQATDSDNRKKLLSKMNNLSEKNRYAYFKCCIALAHSKELIKCICATCEGKVETEERGGEGFGYDPLFTKHEYNKTFSELSESVKNKISHRRKAIDRLLPTLQMIISKS